MTESSDYKVELDAFAGPLDLLLYLIRREEVDIWNIPISRITEQYLQYVEIMGELNINVAGDFIVMAATLIEIKSRMLAPEPVVAEEEEQDDPRMELVRQLMEYRRFKEAAAALTERADLQSQRFTRAGEKLASDDDVKAVGDIGVNLWALLDAFSKVLKQTGIKADHRLVLDNIPQEEIQKGLEERLRQQGRANFFSLFEGESSRVRIVGTFLALLELVKQQALRIEQEETFGDIFITFIPPEQRVIVETPREPEPPQPEPQPEAEPQEPYDGEWPDEELAIPDVPDVEGDAKTSPSTGKDEEKKPQGDDEDEEEYDDDDDDEEDEDEEEYDDDDDDDDEDDEDEDE